MRSSWMLVPALTLSLMGPFAWAGPGLDRILTSAAGRYLILETPGGAELFARTMGKAPAGAAAELDAFLARMKSPGFERAAAKLEANLNRIELRMRETGLVDENSRIFRARTQGVRVGASRRALLARLAETELAVDIRFFPASVARDYNLSRRAFERVSDVRKGGTPVRRYPEGVDAAHQPDAHLQFGFEAEYTLRDAEQLLSVYGPAPKFRVSRAKWLAMEPSARVEWVRKNIDRLFPEERVEGGLVKIVKDRELAFLPERLIQDSTGNLEIILKPVDTLEEWISRVTLLNERVGTGSMQGTVSAPSEAFFAGGTEPNFGFFTFMADLDVLAKLEVGAVRYAKDPTKAAANSFNHPFLGPLTRAKQQRLAEFLNGNARNELLTDEVLATISGSDASFKYIGSTAYRPDIVPGRRVVLEVRDAHTNMPALVERLVRATYYLEEGREMFASARALRSFDSAADFARLRPGLQAMLRDLFPAKIVEGVNYSDAERQAVEVFRNFAYPARDWTETLGFLRAERLRPRVAEAQTRYLGRLAEIERELAAGRITREQAQLRAQGAVAQFAPESGLLEAYERWQMIHFAGDARYGRYVNLAVRELGPLAEAFPASVRLGPLASRIDRFAERWPRSASLVERVRFGYEPIGTSVERDVLVISRRGLSEADQAKLLRDYLDSVSAGTVSFPMSEGGDHLYTRLGDQVFDWWQVMRGNSYRFPSSRRLEPVMALAPDEELRLRFYVDAARRDPDVLGSTQLRGARSGRTQGKLRDNAPTRRNEGHNCTSWVCTAPVGEGKRPLLELAGAQASYDVHTSPGWWTYFLTGASDEGRVPLVVYWTDEPIETALRSVREGADFPIWNFRIN